MVRDIVSTGRGSQQIRMGPFSALRTVRKGSSLFVCFPFLPWSLRLQLQSPWPWPGGGVGTPRENISCLCERSSSERGGLYVRLKFSRE